MNKKKLEKLDRLVEFVQQDFGQITGDNERTKILLEGGDLFQSNLFLNAEDNSTTGYPWKFLCELSGNTKELLEKVILAREQKGFIGFRSYFRLYCDQSDTENRYMLERGIEPGTAVNKVKITIALDEIEFFEIYPSAQVVFDLLTDLPAARLKNCLYCGKVFIQKTAREKILQ